MSRTLLHMEHRRSRAKIKAKLNRMERNTRMRGDNKRTMSVPWLAAMSFYLRNLWAFRHVAKADEAKPK